MRDALKNLFSNKIILEDNSEFYYTITPYELINALGNIIAVLEEYNFTKMDDNNGQIFFKLHRTKEGNWYDIEEANKGKDIALLMALKLAVNAKENCESL